MRRLEQTLSVLSKSGPAKVIVLSVFTRTSRVWPKMKKNIVLVTTLVSLYFTFGM